jgi:hypothetical protein
MARSGPTEMSAIGPFSGVKRTSPRDGCRSIQKRPVRLLLTSFGAGVLRKFQSAMDTRGTHTSVGGYPDGTQIPYGP